MPSVFFRLIAFAVVVASASNANDQRKDDDDTQRLKEDISRLHNRLSEEINARKVAEAASLSLIAQMNEDKKTQQDLDSESKSLRSDLEREKANIAERDKKLKELKDVLSKTLAGPLTAELVDYRLQLVLAVVFGLLNVFALFGPGDVTLDFQMVAGSVLTGLLGAVCLIYLNELLCQDRSSMVDVFTALLTARAGGAAYCLWFLLAGVALIRTRSKFLDAVHDSAYGDGFYPSGEEPLLSRSAEARRQRMEGWPLVPPPPRGPLTVPFRPPPPIPH